MDQQPLFFEDVYDAFRHIVRVIGPKVAGPAIFPQKDPEAAARYLADTLNQNRTEKLDLEQVMQLLRMGREAGCHSAIDYINTISGYAKSTPIDPSDEKAELQRQFNKSVQELTILANRIGVVTGR